MPAGLSPVAAKFRGASGRGLSGSGLRQQADLAVAGATRTLGFSCWQAECQCPSRGALRASRMWLFAYFARVWGSLPLASLALQDSRDFLRKFVGIAAAGRFASDTLVKFFGLAARRSLSVSAILVFLCI